MNANQFATDVVPMSSEFRRLSAVSFSDLRREFLRGTTPDPDDIAGWEFRGLNRPKAAVRLLGIRKFIKGFYQDEQGTWGYNCPVVQNADDDEWSAKPSDNDPKRFGFYRVGPVDAAAVDNKFLHALLLDYGQGDNPIYDPSRGLRDYLVQITDDVLLGIPVFALGTKGRLSLPSYFILNRYRKGLTSVPNIP